MFRKLASTLLFFSLIVISTGQLSAQETESPAKKEKGFYITPRIGLSTMTGFCGIELQNKHVAIDIGYLAGEKALHILTSGIKYYFNSHKSSWYIGAGGGIAMDEYKADKYDHRTETFIGALIGYRWRWGKGWDFNLGIGPLFTQDKISDKDVYGSTEHGSPPNVEISFGFSF